MTTAPMLSSFPAPVLARLRPQLKAVLVTITALALGALNTLAPTQPAQAATTPTLSLSVSTDLTPGQSISTTVSDPSGVLCDQSFGVGEWNVYLSWYRTGLANPVGYSAPQSSQSNAFVAGSSMTINTNFYVVWLEHDAAQSDLSTWDGTYTVVAGCMTAALGTGNVVNGDGNNHTGTPSTEVSTTYVPVAVSRTSIPQGESFDITMTDASQRWCNFTTGSGFSMGVWLASQMAGPPDIAIPADLPNGGVAGVGSFTWANTNSTVTATIPVDAYPGLYTLGVTCIGPSPTYVAGSRAGVFGTIEVTEAPPGPTPDPTPPSPLPSTGHDVSTLAEVAAAALVSVGVGLGMRIHFVRRRNRV